MTRIGLVFVLAALATACSFYMVGTRGHFMETGLSKASFDMNCPAEKLEVVQLAQGSVGVRGCDKQARYEVASTGAWVLNSKADK